MRDPNNLIQVQVSNKDMRVIVLDNVPDFDKEDYDLLDEKDLKKFFKDLEKMCRKSIEYMSMVQFFREDLHMNTCSFYENVSNETTAKIKIHIHHDPLTLFDICYAVFYKRLAFNECMNIEMVAKEVMYLHYNLMVGLIPLSETVHQLVHNNYLFVPTNKVFGNYKKLVDLYRPYFDVETLDVLERIEQTTLTMVNNMDILKQSKIYVQGQGEYELPNLEDIKKLAVAADNAIIKKQENNNINLIDPIRFIKRRKNNE